MSQEQSVISETEPIAAFKNPVIRSKFSAPYWKGMREGVLRMQRCGSCGVVSHPPGPVCKHCMSGDLSWTDLSGEGEIYTYTVVHRAMHPDFEGDVPYVLIYVRLDGGPTVVSWLYGTEPSPDLIGKRVKAIFDEVNEGVQLHRFVVSDAAVS